MTLSFSCIFTVAELNKSKSAWIPSVVILGKVDILHRTKTFKWDPKIFWPSVHSNVTNEQARGSRRTSVAVGAAATGMLPRVIVFASPRRSSATAWAIASASASVPPHSLRKKKIESLEFKPKQQKP